MEEELPIPLPSESEDKTLTTRQINGHTYNNEKH